VVSLQGWNMDLKQISNLIQIAEYGSFSKAASVIGIGQPALGRQVKKLEEEWGTPLLYRHGRGVSLTPDGERLLEQLRPLLRQMESAVLELQDERSSPSGVVTVGLPPTFCGIFGIKLVTALHRDFPRIRLNVVTGYSGYIHEWLTDARIDLAILHDARRSPQIIVDPLVMFDLSLVSARSSLAPAAASQEVISVKELQGVPLVLPTRNHGLRRTVEQAAEEAGITLTVAYEVDTLELMREIAVAGLAHTVLSVSAVQREVNAGVLVVRRIEKPTMHTKLLIASAANRPITRAVKTVDKTIRSIVREMARDPAYASVLRLLNDTEF